jgi:hypothetical protein
MTSGFLQLESTLCLHTRILQQDFKTKTDRYIENNKKRLFSILDSKN